MSFHLGNWYTAGYMKLRARNAREEPRSDSSPSWRHPLRRRRRKQSFSRRMWRTLTRQ